MNKKQQAKAVKNIEVENTMNFGCYILGEIWWGRLIHKPSGWFHNKRKVSIVHLFAAHLKNEYKNLLDEVKELGKTKKINTIKETNLKP